MSEHYRGFAVCEPHTTLPTTATQPNFAHTWHTARRPLSQVRATELTDLARYTPDSHVKSAQMTSLPARKLA